MVSTIDNIEKPDQIIFKHLGMVDKDGNEDTESKEVKEWSGCFEKYILIDFDGKRNFIQKFRWKKNGRIT